MPQISFDHRAVLVDGRRELLVSGAVHYPRSTPDLWPLLLDRSKAAGLNAIETYVFWNLHERRRGVLDFSDRLDLPHFCRLAAARGLHVILRIGPYICAETNFGGFPAWLRDVPGIAIRTFNQPYLAEKERWVRTLCDLLRGHRLFAPQGGPIIAAQVENEYDNVARNYGDDAPKYLQWCVDLAADLKLGVPWLMCLGHGGAGSIGDAIATINAFYGHQRLDQHFAQRGHQPPLWTENWPGWYDAWGKAHHLRSAADVAYGVARFVAAGGTGVNYYMWHGGTNFGREAMYLQTTSYDFDAPLDEFGLTTTKSNHLAALHRLLHDHSATLLGQDRAAPQPLGDQQSLFHYPAPDGGPAVTFVCNDDVAQPATVTVDGQTLRLAAKSVQVRVAGEVVLDTAAVDRRAVVRRKMTPVPKPLQWTTWPEPLPVDRPDVALRGVASPRPIEQLAITHDDTDYCWYSAAVTVAGRKPRTATLRLGGAGDVLHLFVGGKYVASSPPVPVEDRGPFDSPHWKHQFDLTLTPGSHAVMLLAAAVGLIKGDWQIGQQNMALERKGVFGAVTWDGRKVGPWAMLPGLLGEGAVSGNAAAALRWEPARKGRHRPLRWWRCTFDARAASQAPLALDLTGMTKGLIYLNGQCAGRYWQVPADSSGVGAWQKPALDDGPVGVPAQRYYHLPRHWLRPTNELILFEEVAGDPTRVRLVRRS